MRRTCPSGRMHGAARCALLAGSPLDPVGAVARVRGHRRADRADGVGPAERRRAASGDRTRQRRASIGTRGRLPARRNRRAQTGGHDSSSARGQGAFRLRLLDAYRGACAITGEHTEPVLDATHIQPYLGPRSNHPRNGLILTKEFHALFDKGLVTIEPPARAGSEYRVRVSRIIRERWNNGRRYNDFDGAPLRTVPADPRVQPSAEALEWHRESVFEKVA